MRDRHLQLLQARVGVAVVGAVLFGYGVRIDSPGYRWAGIALFAVSLVLRFVKPTARHDGDRAGGLD